MKTKYTERVANVLDEADRFQRVLDHQLFTMEQETRLWGYNPEVDWVPGDPLYPDPRTLVRADGGNLFVQRNDYELEGYYGNCVRPMFELIDDEAPRRWILNCAKCEVGWSDSSVPCWVCGEGQLDDPYKTYYYEYAPSIAFDFDGSSWYRMIERMSDQVEAAFGRMAESMRGLSLSLSRTDEVFDWNITRYEAPTTPSNPFVDERRDIELVPPVAADISTPVWGNVELPADVDLSGRRSPKLPQMSEVRYSNPPIGYRGTPITEMRRRRNL